MEKSQPHLMAQDAATVDASKLTALTPEVVRSPFFLYGCVVKLSGCGAVKLWLFVDMWTDWIDCLERERG